ncbi:hypothetical protein [Aerococcus kribbianus]|uniref:Uncharacterized protein n=1 Tax=Aerococcus kribbianus TaxID=2999064 RepID=A0A9X3JEM7_9LACT|nr:MULTISPECIES: hypothetical protein [unclassified Aerococcus]MCZ0717319.1 hypothetical protein [Aerococcus sp. YH-aer221]MCZ0725607.1 hypothetical protein [Aerococcus sp. YH-aer222]
MYEWSQSILDQAIAASPHYQDRALLAAVKEAIQETDKRLAQAEGQLDGLAWNKEEWE